MGSSIPAKCEVNQEIILTDLRRAECRMGGTGQEELECKTKRPGLGLSHGTFVDQPSPKCCSRTRISRAAEKKNGP
jgi:hypothetical protein